MSANPHLITFYELQYWSNGIYPTREEVCKQFGFTFGEFEEALQEIIKPLESRGLPDPTPKKKEKPPVKEKTGPENLLDPLFVLAVGQIVDTMDKRATAAKLKALGLTTAQFKAHLRKQDHREYFETRLNATFNQDVENSAKLSIARNVEAGDLQSIKYFHEYTGRYRPDAGLGMNIGILLGRFMEILASRLAPEQMAEIADEFESAILDTQSRELSA